MHFCLFLTQGPDPWGRSSPATDPWQSSNTGAISRQPMPSSLAGASNETWMPRTHSPSVASGSSNEGWLQNNAAAANGNGNVASNASQSNDPWLSKPPPKEPNPWQNKAPETNDAWQSNKPAAADPWAPIGNIGVSSLH